MPDFDNLLKAIKKAAVDAVNASKPASICFGTVTKTNPIEINIDQKTTLSLKQLVPTRNVTDFKTYITGGNIKNFYYTSNEPNSPTQPVSPPHVHAVGKIGITVHNGLNVGDEVVLLQMQGGQKYIILDRVCDT